MHKIFEMTNHSEIKPLILSYIDSFRSTSGDGLITKSDWDQSLDFTRPYFEHIKPFIEQQYCRQIANMGGSGFHIRNFWFQQYQKGGEHPWHSHPSAHFSNIYYLELPDDAPRTEFRNILNPSEIYNYDVKDGDVLMFPAYYPHRSPAIFTDSRKTVVVFNTCMEV